MVKGVIFDFDGVIIDSEPIHFKIEMGIFREMGIQISEPEYMQFLGISERDTYNQIKKTYKVNFDNEKILEEKINRFIYYIDNLDKFPTVPGILDVIYMLHKQDIKLALGSSGTKEIATHVLKKLNIFEMFTSIVCGSDVENTKPKPDIFIKSLQNLELKNTECIVIEDAENGILAAHSAGIKVIGYRQDNLPFNEMAKPDIHLSDFSALDINIITKLL